MSISEDNGQPLAIEVKDVSVSYGGTPVLQNVSLSIPCQFEISVASWK